MHSQLRSPSQPSEPRDPSAYAEASSPAWIPAAELVFEALPADFGSRIALSASGPCHISQKASLSFHVTRLHDALWAYVMLLTTVRVLRAWPGSLRFSFFSSVFLSGKTQRAFSE